MTATLFVLWAMLGNVPEKIQQFQDEQSCEVKRDELQKKSLYPKAYQCIELDLVMGGLDE